MQFEWKLTAGNLLTFTSVIISGLFFIFSIRADVQILSVEVNGIKSQLIGVNSVLTAVAVQNERLSTLERAVNKLSDETKK